MFPLQSYELFPKRPNNMAVFSSHRSHRFFYSIGWTRMGTDYLDDNKFRINDNNFRIDDNMDNYYN